MTVITQEELEPEMLPNPKLVTMAYPLSFLLYQFLLPSHQQNNYFK
jgi:hypothetical protein